MYYTVKSYSIFSAVFRRAWKRWAEKTNYSGNAAVPNYTYEEIMKEVKQRMKNYLETRRERMLTRLGISGIRRIREYSIIGGGKAYEVRANALFNNNIELF